MKKYLWKSILCLLCVFALTAVCFAAEPDLSAMTDDEILALQQQLNTELVARGLEKTATLAKGSYIAGKDLPCGSYVYTCLATGDDWGNVTVYSDGGDGDQLLWEIVGAPENGADPETIFIRLNEGDELKSGVAFSLTISPAVLFK